MKQPELVAAMERLGHKTTVGNISGIEREYDRDAEGNPTRPGRHLVEAAARALDWDVNEALILAGHAPKDKDFVAPAKPQNLVEFIQALERLGLDFGTLSGQIEIIEKYTPDEFQDLIDRIVADVRIDIEQKMRRLLK